ncbi:MAG TPA: type II toxin-antitoxin system RelE/ParE family toxin [Rhodocyclaceae bacterium]|nr:type II toxin-antitoxin system RelE/ParE family toxin [Rhodocyclaceae bacterium]
MQQRIGFEPGPSDGSEPLKQIFISRAAEQDLLDGYWFYEGQQEGIGTYFLDSLIADIDSLALFGGVHAKPHGEFFRALSKRFPFAIYYTEANDQVIVVAVLDCRQNPASITQRLS